MMDEDDEINGIFVDDDPALDYMLYDDMQEDGQKQRQSGGGCLGVFLLFLLPVVPGFVWLMR